MMMKTIHEFVIKENPKKGINGKNEIIEILKQTYMNPMERELIITKLEAEPEKTKDLKYRSDLILEWLSFHKEDIRYPLLIEGIAMDNILLERFMKGFIDCFPGYAFAKFDAETHGPWVLGLIGVSEQYLEELGLSMVYFKDKYFKKKDFGPRVSLILEILSFEKAEDDLIVYCMIYDRHHNKQGYVAFLV